MDALLKELLDSTQIVTPATEREMNISIQKPFITEKDLYIIFFALSCDYPSAEDLKEAKRIVSDLLNKIRALKTLSTPAERLYKIPCNPEELQEWTDKEINYSFELSVN